MLRSSDVVSGLLQKTASFGLSLCRTPQPRLEQRVLLEQRYAFFCGKRHRFFGRKNLTVADLQGENFVSFTSDQMGGNLSPLTVFRDQQGFTGRIVASSPSLDEILRLVGAGYGIGCLPEHIVAADVQANEAMAFAAVGRGDRCEYLFALEPRTETDPGRVDIPGAVPADAHDHRPGRAVLIG